jgi:hypothetical protein
MFKDIEIEGDRYEEEQKLLDVLVEEILKGEVFIVGTENIEKAISSGKIQMADKDDLPF